MIFFRSMRRYLVVGACANLADELSDEDLPGVCEAESIASAPIGEVYDAITIACPDTPPRLIEAVERLAEFGAVYLFLGGTAPDGETIEARLHEAGLQVFLRWRRNAHGVLNALAPDDAGPVEVVMAVRAEHDPVLHARALIKARRPDWALEVLSNVPDQFFTSLEHWARAAAERQLCYLAWDSAAGNEGRLNRFASEQREFYHVTNILPTLHQAYLCHARFWHVLGDDDMAARTLRSVQYINHSPAVDAHVRAYETQTQPRADEPPPPEFSGKCPPRILMVCHEQSDYGHDVLYDGLVSVLGAESVVEFPYKPTLHGGAPEIAVNYPCTFTHPGEPHDLEWVLAELREGAFDWVFYCDTLCQLDQDMARRIMTAAGDRRLFLLDTWDDCGDYSRDVLAHIGRTDCTAGFKREMLACADYGPRTFPLPFAYPDGRIPERISYERPEPLFWAGKRQDGARRLCLDHLEATRGLQLDARYTQEEYVRAIEYARIGLNLFGLGFDTVRYWELPAHGCLLLSERPPTRIPNNFRDGESAVFFDDFADLEQKLDHYLAHPDEIERIARTGHEHLKQHHTASARARQLLGHIEHVLRGT